MARGTGAFQACSKLVHASLPVCSCPSRPPPACLSALARPGRLLPVQAGSCPLLPVQACSYPPAPHEVGVCHRLWPVSFSNFVCLFGFARLLVSAPSRLQACSCLLHMKSVFVTGYGLCHFPTSCDFPRPWPRPPCDFPRPRPPPRVSFRGRARARPHRAPLCLSEAADEAAHPQAHPRTSAHAVRGPVSRPPLYPTNGPDVTACRTRSPKLRCLPVPSGAVACSTGS